MNIEEWPIYVGDTGHVACNASPPCEEWDWSHIGHRADVGKFLKALRKHAKEAHGIEIEENEVVAIRTPDGESELAYDRRNVTEFSTSRGIRQTSCDEEGHPPCRFVHRRLTEEFTLTLKFRGLDSQPMWRGVPDGS